MSAWRMPRRLFAAAVGSVCLFVGGCSNFFPSFSGNFAARDVEGDEVPLPEVVNSVQCEVAAFLKTANHYFGSNFSLKKNGQAKVTLQVDAKFEAGVNYAKIDVTQSSLLKLLFIPGDSDNKFPGLNISGFGQNTAEIVVSIPQNPSYAQRIYDKCYPYPPTARGPRPVEGKPFANTYNALSHKDLGLTEWLFAFNERTSEILVPDAVPKPKGKKVGNKEDEAAAAKLKSIKLSTAFSLEVDFSSSVKRLIRIVPIENYPVATIDPTNLHKLTIEFEGTDADSKDKGAKTGKGVQMATLTECLLLQKNANQPAAPGSQCRKTIDKAKAYLEKDAKNEKKS